MRHQPKTRMSLLAPIAALALALALAACADAPTVTKTVTTRTTTTGPDYSQPMLPAVTTTQTTVDKTQ